MTAPSRGCAVPSQLSVKLKASRARRLIGQRLLIGCIFSPLSGLAPLYRLMRLQQYYEGHTFRTAIHRD